MENTLNNADYDNENQSNALKLNKVTKKMLRIDNPRRVRQFLNRLTNELYYGNISNDTARTLNSIMQTYLKVFELEKKTAPTKTGGFFDNLPTLESLKSIENYRNIDWNY